MTHTTKLNLNKPDLNDNVNVATDINENMDKIDAAYSKITYPSIGDTSASSHSRIDELGERTFSTWINTNYLSYAGKWAIGIQTVLNASGGASHSELQVLIIGQEKPNVVSRAYNNNAWSSWTDINSNIGKQLFFGPGHGKYYEASSTTIDGAVSGVSPTNDNDGFFTINNANTVAGYGNRQFIFGWLNSGKTYGWCLILSFNGIGYGTRYGANTFTIRSL